MEAASKGLKRQLRRERAVLHGKAMTARKRSKTLEIAERSLREGRLEGIIDGPKSGRWGKWEYYMRRGKQCCRRHGERKKSRTPAQGQARDAFGGPAQAWGKKLTQEQRDAWNGVAKQEWSKPRLAQKGPLHGEQVFTGRSSVLLKVGKELLLWPTPKPVFKPNPVAGLSIGNGSDGVRIRLGVSGPVSEDIMVLGQAPCSAGRKKWRRGVYLCRLSAATGEEIDITADYVARFGEPEPGKKVFIRTQQQKDGWKDFPTHLSEVVPVTAEAVGREDATEGTGAAVCGFDGLNQLHKLPGLQGLYGAGGVGKAAAASRSEAGNGVRCTREWFRIATATIPLYYRRQAHGSGQKAECRMHTATGGRWQARMGETSAGPQIRMLGQQLAGGLNRIEVTISHFPGRLGQIPIELALNIGNEVVRLADTHAPAAGVRFRARCRIPSKSALVSGVAG